MAKKRLTSIAEEYGITFEKSTDLVFEHLGEEMVSGKGKNTWINEDGQRILEEVIAMPVLYRGPVLSVANNNRFVYCYIKEICRKVPVMVIPRFARFVAVGKVIYIRAELNEATGETQYYYEMPPKRS